MDETAEWAKKAFDRNFEPINSSHIFLSLQSTGSELDPLACLQLGIAIMLDKPILVVSEQGKAIPDALKAIALGSATYEKGNKHSMEQAVEKIVKTHFPDK